MSYNFSNGMPSASMPRPWEHIGYVDPMQQFGNGQYSSMSTYGSPDVPQLDLTGINRQSLGGGGYADLGTNLIPDYANSLGQVQKSGGGIWDFLWGQNTKDSPGAFGSLVGAGTGILNSLLGWNNYKLAESKLAFDKKAYEASYAAQRNVTNSNMAGQYNALLHSTGTNGNGAGVYLPLDAYMNTYGVKPLGTA